MPNSKDIYKWMVEHITVDEPSEEVAGIAYLLLEKKFNITRSQIIAGREVPFSEGEAKGFIDRINKGEPIQYIIGTQEFYGREFEVNPSVLIPRPETELLVSTVLSHLDNLKISNPKILDIGTGSGCIPITLQLEIGLASIGGIDISETAIATARRNNARHHTEVRFSIADVLSQPLPDHHYDIIVGNPPYVTEKEKPYLKENVLNFEPHLALFVPDHDPLLFYKAIARKSRECLNYGGAVVVEVNELHGNDVEVAFMDHSFRFIELIKDYSGKDRVVKAIL
ncbi:MAG: peptide chain release factor N(5)-glutamine methyltransferase [Cyclobacteriaceae bacterium]|nr:peptide chain release factor N(5)-glutamine methyltransferase [Cyclobacteriaceae bacterium]MCB9237518.1 peptide chain release factor N(5)-glutamine methyltransferase [Flammeovirgaceae bacterium]MCB0500311.1 peptide chain release factor N(5)-glutamine methyltransferase [Cyclobacteriaceae bacterium]MCO5270379.1 peptide chain release factor N(5)-glutamine methyltransferase [Cyclobacteriaceae bacterium]MCW5903550.1 peptide chain release factor N(5)-glutamine methyltransferase [Cyclobacteriaceae 